MSIDPDFRPDSSRGIFLSGVIDSASVSNLFPQIVRIQDVGPITLYIDSPGGRPSSALLLQRMLTAPSHDSSVSRRLITVATGLAASAAADLLVAGDYTLVYQHALIMMHGVRQASSDDITSESAADLAQTLAYSNEQFALTLASNCVGTFFFRVVEHFAKDLAENQGTEFDHIGSFVEDLKSKVSTDIFQLLLRAVEQYREMTRLYTEVSHAIDRLFSDPDQLPRTAIVEAAMFKALIDYELEAHPDPNWTFGNRAFERLQQKVQLLFDQSAQRHRTQVTTLRERWGYLLLTMREQDEFLGRFDDPARREELERIAEGRIRNFWFLLVAVCRNLQTADYYLSAEEAYWLGFIDEVIGRPDLLSPRVFAEFDSEAEAE